MNKSILFVEPQNIETNFHGNIIYQPLLGPITLATQLYELGYNVTVIKETLIDEDTLNNALKDADILILTLLTASAKRGYRIAEKYKKNRPDGRVIAGGIHVSFVPDEAIQYVDQVAIGEGHSIIQDLVDGKNSEKIVHGSPVEDLDQLPIPHWPLLVNYQKLTRIPIMASLGCPFDCTFCCVTKMYGRKYRFQSPERTIEQLKHHFQQLGDYKVFFIDDNFSANKKNSLKLFDKIEENNLDFLWGCQIRADVTKDEEFVKRMAEVGCHRVYVGYESINQNTLDSFKKKESLSDIEHSLAIFHKYGISVCGMFILGGDHDNLKVIEDTVSFALKNNIEHTQYSLIGPFPGTDVRKNLDKSRLAHNNWEMLDAYHVNIIPKQMTEYELVMGLLYAHEKFYSWLKIVKQLWVDIQYIIINRRRSIGYRFRKLREDIGKIFTYRNMIRTWKNAHAEYHKTLKEKHDLITNNSQPVE